ncbi:MAG: hypothetical protein GX945_02690 [Lentisphaerae bacterium]|nr:hypothetical protein [Lentisphaerota bacterium]
MLQIKRLVIGGTMLGCGLAMADPTGTLLVERGMVLGYDFSAALHQPSCPDATTPAGRELAEAMVAWGLFVDGRVHLPPVADLLATRLHEQSCRVLLYTEVMKIAAGDGGGWLVTLWNRDGMSTVAAEHIVDSTSEGVGHTLAQGVPLRKSICGAMVATVAGAPPPESPEPERWCCVRGALPDELTLKVALPMDAGWPQARQALHDTWAELRGRGLARDWQLAAEAGAIACEYSAPINREVEPSWHWRPSASYGSLMAAYEGRDA